MWGSSWAQKATPVGPRGACPHKQGVPGTRRGLTLRADGRTSWPDPQGQAPSEPVLMAPPAPCPQLPAPHTRAAAPVAALPTSQHQAPAAPGAVLADSAVALLSTYCVPSPAPSPSHGSPNSVPSTPSKTGRISCISQGKTGSERTSGSPGGRAEPGLDPVVLHGHSGPTPPPAPGSPREHQVPPCPGWASIPEKQRGHSLPGIPPLSGSPAFCP